ncbi:MAG: hypothetical protein Q4D80_05520 [Pseudomonadota bacterium]|nr:hypothetical protein [Pseudomonadota bacterium]
MTFVEFFKGIPQRMRFRINFLTVFEFLYALSIPFIISYAPPQLFVENSWFENMQLFILLVAFILALRAPHDKKLFMAVALIIVLMLLRETNMGRSYFCEKYLSPDEMCRWKKLKYGFIAEPLRNLYGLYILYYIWRQKVYQTFFRYVLHAPIYVFDISILILSAVAATLAEHPLIDNEILEESCEMLMYLAFLNNLWFYRKLG